jgi:hypothetical protein
MAKRGNIRDIFGYFREGLNELRQITTRSSTDKFALPKCINVKPASRIKLVRLTKMHELNRPDIHNYFTT